MQNVTPGQGTGHQAMENPHLPRSQAPSHGHEKKETQQEIPVLEGLERLPQKEKVLDGFKRGNTQVCQM